MLDKKHDRMPSGEGVGMLRNWKAFRDSLWRMTPERYGAEGPVLVVGLSEGSLALDFSGKVDTLDLTGARFKSVPPEDVQLFAPGQIVRCLLISLRGGAEVLLLEEARRFSGEPIM